MPPPVATLLAPANLAVALIALSFIAFAAFGIDKAAAGNGERRIAERDWPCWADGGSRDRPGAGARWAGEALRHSNFTFLPAPRRADFGLCRCHLPLLARPPVLPTAPWPAAYRPGRSIAPR